MGEPRRKPEVNPQAAVALTAADAARAVKRVVPALDDDGKPTGETRLADVAEAEVFAWALRGDQVTVVTIDGQKLVGTL